MTDIDKLAMEIIAADYGSKGFPEVAKSIRDGFDGFDLDIAAARIGILEGMKLQRERDAVIAYRVCAETRHVTLGQKCEAAIRSAL